MNIIMAVSKSMEIGVGRELFIGCVFIKGCMMRKVF